MVRAFFVPPRLLSDNRGLMDSSLPRCGAILFVCVLMVPMETQAQARSHAALDGLGPRSKTALIVSALTQAGAPMDKDYGSCSVVPLHP
jgi:hypothetical protein